MSRQRFSCNCRTGDMVGRWHIIIYGDVPDRRLLQRRCGGTVMGDGDWQARCERGCVLSAAHHMTGWSSALSTTLSSHLRYHHHSKCDDRGETTNHTAFNPNWRYLSRTAIHRRRSICMLGDVRQIEKRSRDGHCSPLVPFRDPLVQPPSELVWCVLLCLFPSHYRLKGFQPQTLYVQFRPVEFALLRPSGVGRTIPAPASPLL